MYLPTALTVDLYQRMSSLDCAFVPVAVSEDQVLSVVKKGKSSPSRDVYGMFTELYSTYRLPGLQWFRFTLQLNIK